MNNRIDSLKKRNEGFYWIFGGGVALGVNLCLIILVLAGKLS